MMASRSRRFAARATIGLILIVVARAANAAQTCGPDDLGCRIFNGQYPLQAHLRDDDRALPAWTTRCVNCHTQTGPTAAFAPPLTSDSLLAATRRRGGPPSTYDPATFCHALKDGIDPAEIVLRKSMPQYQISDAQCAALWRFVTNQ